MDPCDDFYQFSCGGWLKKTQIPDSRTRYSRFEQLSEQNSIILKKILDDLKNKPRNASVHALVHFCCCCIGLLVVQISEIIAQMRFFAQIGF